MDRWSLYTGKLYRENARGSTRTRVVASTGNRYIQVVAKAGLTVHVIIIVRSLMFLTVYVRGMFILLLFTLKSCLVYIYFAQYHSFFLIVDFSMRSYFTV
jgi:hypothetical protein